MQPPISVVTPVRNGERFIRQTIESVLAQDYPALEYLIVDGGSTDRTLEIARRFGDRITLISGSDSGQAEALNLGFARARGEILGWLNADDLYTSGALAAVAAAFAERPGVDVIYGNADHIDDEGRVLDPYPVEPFDRRALARRCFICQPAAFVRRSALHAVGALDPTLHYALDYDLWIRLCRTATFAKIDRELAYSRMHPANKTLSSRRAAYEEAMDVLRRNYGYVPYEWVYGYASFLLDGRDQYFEPSRRTRLKVLLSLALGVVRNPLHPLRFIRDWISHRGFAVARG